jgi:hypothetical protein
MRQHDIEGTIEVQRRVKEHTCVARVMCHSCTATRHRPTNSALGVVAGHELYPIGHSRHDGDIQSAGSACLYLVVLSPS